MVKNEQDHVLKTLESVKDHILTYVVLDTGSTDQTVSQIKEWCAAHDKCLLLKETTFVNFEETRNELLEFAECAAPPQTQWLLLADASDEFRGEWDALVSLTQETSAAGILIQQRWTSGTSVDVYKNNRCIRRSAKWRYRGVVHEYLTREKTALDPNAFGTTAHCPTSFYIFQDRTKDGNKSAARFEQDYAALKTGLNAEPDNERYLFYMGQTCRCLGRHAEACLYYRRYLELGSSFTEEVFHAKWSLGNSLLKNGCHQMGVEMLLAAHECLATSSLDGRVEPLADIADHYIKQKKWHLAYLFLQRACRAEVPTNLILFLDLKYYNYTRWHLMGIAAFYAGKHKEGREAAARAVLAATSEAEREMNKTNLQFYDAVGK